ncbi:MAG: glycosyl hydrolase [Firmicutes bacterium]|jgi:beta-glucosidase|nr:glycosyl hydrolase [Bacillota bacterium]
MVERVTKEELASEFEVDGLLKELTLAEKSILVSGADRWRTVAIPRLNIPSIMVADGPHGLRKEEETGDLAMGKGIPATCFPPAATLANSWDPELAAEVGKAIGREALEQGVSVVLGPGVNIKRSPLCGRNFEYFSEDPFLTASLATGWVKGIQGVGVGACLKHFAANSQEAWRMLNDSLVDERALREIYLAAFEKVIKEAQPWSVMAAYNKLNGTYCCEHPKLLTDILRREWGFQGLVVSDWGAVDDPVLSIRAGLDLEMPSSYGFNVDQIKKDLESGRLTQVALNRAVRNVLTLVDKACSTKLDGYTYDRQKHHDLARRAAAQSAVLLKNEGDILPLKQGQAIAVIGQFAQHPRYQGVGSSQVNPTQLDTFLDELTERDIAFNYARGYSLESDEVNPALLDEACIIAEGSEVVVIFAGLTGSYESEGFDRYHLELPEAHNELIRRVAEVNDNVVVVLAGGSPVTMPWLDQVRGVLHTYLAGQAGAGAVVDILYGQVNPSGKLAETYPLKLEDCPAHGFFASDRYQTEYRESIFVGYRYYDTAERDVLFPFGFGLSYTQFEYSNLTLSAERIKDSDTLAVSCTVKNIGKRSGAEIVQLYLGKKESPLFRAVRELKGFKKIWLEPGEEKTVRFELGGSAFAYFNVEIQDWHVEEGEYQVCIGSSARELPLQAAVVVETSRPEVVVPDYRESAPTYYNLKTEGLPWEKSAFEAIYGRKIIKVRPAGEYHPNSTLGDLQKTRLGRLIVNILRREMRKFTPAAPDNDPLWRMMWTIVLDTPLRAFPGLSGGMVSPPMLQGLVAWANGHPIQALKLWLDLRL